MNNIEKQLYIQGDFVVDITPLEVMELVDETFQSLSQTELIKPNELFKLAWYYYLTPKELLMLRKFNRKSLVYLMEGIGIEL